MSEPDLQHLRGWIGREEIAHDSVTPELARRFLATFGLDRGEQSAGAPAPRLIHFCLAQPAAETDTLGPDGHPRKGGFLPPVPLPRRMWAGGAITFHRDISIGEEVRRTSRILDVTEKTGRSGRLVFVTVAHELSAGGTLLIEERQDLVYREASTGAAQPQAAAAAAPAGAHRRERVASPVLLFRYSAMTFNGHRIHYDHPYATGVEGYSGLVVHAPMQATMLLHLATEIAGRAPDRFSFRGQSPLIDGPLTLNADAGGDRLKLWTSAPGGPVALSAEAEWMP